MNPTQAKRCSECGKVLRGYNKSGLCERHKNYDWMIKNNKLKKKLRIK